MIRSTGLNALSGIGVVQTPPRAADTHRGQGCLNALSGIGVVQTANRLPDRLRQGGGS